MKTALVPLAILFLISTTILSQAQNQSNSQNTAAPQANAQPQHQSPTQAPSASQPQAQTQLQTQNSSQSKGQQPAQPQAQSTSQAQNQAEYEPVAEQDRIEESGHVLKEVMDNPDKGIPKNVLNSAKCVIVIPSMKKAAFLLGANYGRGVMTCRTGQKFGGPWSPPIMMATGGASAGLQVGGQATDYVVLVMNDGAARNLLGGTKVKLGAGASVTAGPVGNKAEAATQGKLRSEMVSYSHTHGLFAGASLSGANLRPDSGGNYNFYGQELSGQDIVDGKVKMPPEAKQLIVALPKTESVAEARNDNR
jgi:lipid-binding SYLF domain-containing protein